MRKKRREVAVMAGRTAVDNNYTLVYVEFEMPVEYPNREFKGRQLTS